MYQCGNGKTFSKVFTFKALPGGSDFGVRVALFGDMGSVNAQSLPRLLKDVQNDMYDAIFHVGKGIWYCLRIEKMCIHKLCMLLFVPLISPCPVMHYEK